jgi:hypothetical protein
MLAGAARRALRPAERVTAALADPARQNRTVLGLLVAYVILWTLYGLLAKASQDLHFDMVELVGWSRELSLGNDKHPPFAAWLVGLWFSIFPVADWSYYLLAISTAATGLWFAWRLSGHYLDGDKRVVGFALLSLVPFFSFHALKFNVNTVLIPVWAATTLWFLRSFESQSGRDAALAGVGAGAAMLSKYWSVFLLAGLGLAALLDRRRADYFRSAAPWITVAVGAVVLAPHLAWLIAHDFAPFSYAFSIHGTKSEGIAALSVLTYLAGSLAYVAAPIGLALAAMRPGRPAITEVVWPQADSARLAVAAFWCTLLLPAVVAVAAGVKINSIWTMSGWALLPVVLLGSPRVVVPRHRTVHLVAFACVVPLAMVAAAPFIAGAIHRAGGDVKPSAAHAAQLAEKVELAWREATDRPLRLVGGDADLAYGVGFYLRSRPGAVPAIEVAGRSADQRITRDGAAIVCFATSESCIASAQARAEGHPGARHRDVALVRRFWGVSGPPNRYVIVVVPPRV